MLSVYEFLNKLNRFYPSNDKEEIFTERVNEYANAIIARSREKKENYDYDKVFSHIMQTYKYKQFPSLPDIIDNLEYGVIVEESYSGKEGEVVKRVVNGIEYEFVIVPNHWKGIKTISQLDEDIKRKTKGD